MARPSSNCTTGVPIYERLVFPVLSLVTLILLWLAPAALPLDVQLAMLALLVVVFGLPHGALDPWLAERGGLSNHWRALVIFNVLYMGIAALVVLIWMWLPAMSLAIFLVISAWHFGGDWRAELSLAPRLVAGSMLLLLPIGFHEDNVAMLFGHLSGAGGQALAQTLALPTWLLSAVMAALIGLACWRRHWLAALEFACLLLLASAALPLVYFAVYFCSLHSLRHLAGLFRQAPPIERPRLWRMAVVYTLATLALAGVLWGLWAHLPLDTLVLKLVFIGLAAVTMPHMMLMVWVHRHLTS